MVNDTIYFLIMTIKLVLFSFLLVHYVKIYVFLNMWKSK